MKKQIILLIFFVNYIFAVLNSNVNQPELKKNEPLLVVVIMIKNEEKVIVPTLEPFVKGGIKSFFIFDTGSTDNTISVVENFFKQKQITDFFIKQEPFIDFATSRNRALDLAQESFPNAVFMLMPDAEWYINDVPGLLDFCEKHTNDINNKAFLIKMNSNINFDVPRLIRCRSGVKFVGAVHEIPMPSSGIKLPETVFFNLGMSKQGFEKSKKRWERDLVILQKKYDEIPADTRNIFYLAQTYECLGDFNNAFKYYELRSKLPGWDEEDYETFYRLGNVTMELSKTDSNFTKLKAFDYYAIAYKMRPHRAEPIIKMAQIFWPDNIPLCFLLAKSVLDFQYPKNEFLFVDKSIYDFYRYEMLSKSAWYMQQFEIGEMATKKAIEVCPDAIQLYKNLVCYLEKKVESLKKEK